MQKNKESIQQQQQQDRIQKIEDEFYDFGLNSKTKNKKILLVQQKLEEDAEDDLRIKFSQLHPAEQKIVKHGALQFDIKLGWVPKAQITGPIPIAFAHPDMDDLISEHIPTKSFIYFGYRPSNSFDIHKHFYKQGKNYPFNQFHLCKSQFLERFFKKYYSDFQYDSIRKQGMVSESPLIFDSFFQGGNLDAVYFQQDQYKLVARVDTNTRGHCHYYYFKVKCTTAGKYRFRIVNMSKHKSLYQRGMRPYVRTKQNPNWTQGCQNVKFGVSKLCQQYELSTKMSSLKFQYEFKKPEQWVQISYGIPFTYSDLLKLITQFRSNQNFHINKLCHTLSGLQIPLITITQSEKEKQTQNVKKQVIALSARVHPGQTHGSHILNGFIKTLLSNKSQASALRKNVIFKIIPMINPDGVVIGNTRTSLAGKDLNRVYSDKTDFVFPQVIGIRDFTKKLKQKYGNRFLFFIDIHGHSTRKNSFFFGPEYSVFDEQYPKCRLLPKIFANVTDIFRYYSCKFRLSSFKQKTCRGYFNSNNIVRTYTYQTSMHSYFDFEKRKDAEFNQQSLQMLGNSMMMAIHGYVMATVKLEQIKIPEPVNKKKQLRKLEDRGQEQENSDEMPSEKADSQDSNDDLGINQLQIFYNRINENRQYFFQELMQFNNIPFTKQDKKQKKKQVDIEQKLIEASQKDNQQRKDTNVQQNWKKQQKTKIEWIPRQSYVPKKKQFLQYEKLSNVIFGGGGSTQLITIKNNLLYTSRQEFDKFKKSKYTFVNPIFYEPKETIQQQERAQRKYQSVLNKYSDFRLQSKSRFFNHKEQNSFRSNSNGNSPLKTKSNQQLQGQIIANKNNEIKKKIINSQDNLQRLLFQPKNLAILVQKQSARTLKQQNKQKESLRSTSLKILPRKKSIKSFRNSQQKVTKKVVKNMSEKGLATKLPYIDRIISNF